MKTIMHKSDTRGNANFGWLNSYHSFSFGNYYNPERMNFGALRVLNDDTVSSGKGFGKHPHDNMEIISIPLEGDLEHEDSMGNTAVIKQGDVQVMSAGTGIFHSEYNKNSDKEVKFLQIWITPDKKNVSPRYDQISIDDKNLKNNLHQIISPNANDTGVWLHQNAWFHLGNLENENTQTYTLKDKKNGVYAFLLEGNVSIEDQVMEQRDGLGIWDVEQIKIKSNGSSKILLIEVPITL
ncbi:pirin family protein [uncultured Aquimarina sp.]|uniref:pirin family protein n=1 Tax=uncultured Aquimarina sp. TaxID=575652 RepID=UPI002639A8C2|nr:pirin family protein [uncultured Aquimarina sp.]